MSYERHQKCVQGTEKLFGELGAECHFLHVFVDIFNFLIKNSYLLQ